ncbi:hypothetical protein GCM10011374_41370 [Kocuria dechangensis]|uniref:Uncharacterized protein n=1 Tax=Kocuria dechangensis TaxID=1176249 RepID=A0A917HB45_9MICC|nr:hypothetical protein GCM10011374_41370 [Kocuria dechangensis]
MIQDTLRPSAGHLEVTGGSQTVSVPARGQRQDRSHRGYDTGAHHGPGQAVPGNRIVADRREVLAHHDHVPRSAPHGGVDVGAG